MNTEIRKESGDWQIFCGEVAVPTLLLLAAVIGIDGVLWVEVHAGNIPLWLGSLCAIVMSYASFTVLHEAAHGNIRGQHSRFLWVEEVAGWISGMLLLAPFPAFRVLHLLHHAHTNHPENDPDHWVVGRRPWSIAARCLSILASYYHNFLHGTASQTSAAKQARRSTLWGVAGLLLTFVGLIWAGFFTEVLWLWVVPGIVASGILAFLFDWVPHHPHQVQEKYHNTRILLVPGLTLVMLWQNFHLIHHLYPRVPFYRYHQCFQAVRSVLELEQAPIEGWNWWGTSETLPLPLPFEPLKQVKPLVGIVSQPKHTGTESLIRWRVTHTIRETADVITIGLEPINTAGQPVTFLAGQFLPVCIEISGQLLWRCYSISSAPELGSPLTITVKRVPDGRVSTWIHQSLAVGDELLSRPPAGEFVLPQQLEKIEQLVMIAGGSGVTPVMAMIEYVLACSTTRVVLVDGNRCPSDIIFAERLELLEQRYPDRFCLRHVVQSASENWIGETGLLTQERLRLELEQAGVIDSPGRHYFVCGPAPMMKGAMECLTELGALPHRIHCEQFQTLTENAVEATGESEVRTLPPVPVTFLLAGTKFEIEVGQHETLLQAGLRARLPMVHACGTGNCGSCLLRLQHGDVSVGQNSVLLAEEQEQGLILPCVTKACGPCAVQSL
jgi:ferredoxin-NADP reductase/fatty acid desaturase